MSFNLFASSAVLQQGSVLCAAIITHVLDVHSSCAGLLGRRSEEDCEWQPPVGAIRSAEEEQENADDASGG